MSSLVQSDSIFSRLGEAAQGIGAVRLQLCAVVGLSWGRLQQSREAPHAGQGLPAATQVRVPLAGVSSCCRTPSALGSARQVGWWIVSHSVEQI